MIYGKELHKEERIISGIISCFSVHLSYSAWNGNTIIQKALLQSTILSHMSPSTKPLKSDISSFNSFEYN